MTAPQPAPAPPATRPALAVLRAMMGAATTRLVAGALFALTLVALAGRAQAPAPTGAPPLHGSAVLTAGPLPPASTFTNPGSGAQADTLVVNALLYRFDALIRAAESRALRQPSPEADEAIHRLRELRAQTYTAARAVLHPTRDDPPHHKPS